MWWKRDGVFVQLNGDAVLHHQETGGSSITAFRCKKTSELNRTIVFVTQKMWSLIHPPHRVTQDRIQANSLK